ncbi:MAG TPA: hypothetical protein VIF37_20635 [Methylobacter sp.]|jgi:hypothetical protein
MSDASFSKIETQLFTTNDCTDAGGTTPWMGEVEQRRERLPRAMQEQLPRHEGHEEIKLRVLRVFVVIGF